MMISVITSTFREFENMALQSAIGSVLAQTYHNWEMIIVGDHTPFNQQIHSYLTKLNDNRIKFTNLAKRAGIGSPGTIPKIKGLTQANGELLCFLDADNLYLPDHLEKCVSAFERQPDLDLVYANSLIKRAARRSEKSDVFSFIWRKPDWNAKRVKQLLRSNFLDMSETIFTKKAYTDAGGLDTSHQSSDWVLWKKMIKSGHDNFRHLNHLGLIYHTTSLKHHLQYYILMLMQNSGLRYQSNKLKFMQRNISKRIIAKHALKPK